MWRKLLSVEYLLEPIPGQPAQFRLFYFLLSVCAGFGLFLSASMRRKRHDPNLRRALTVEAGLTVMALSSVGFAFAGVPFLSMRILVFGSSWIALLYPILVWVRLRERVNLLGRHRRAWSGQMNVLQPQLPLYTSFLLVGVHFVGLAMLASYYGWPWWSPLLLLFSLLSPQLLFSLSAWRWRVHLEALAPIFLVYAVLAARLLLLIGAKLLRYPHFFLPSAWDTLWNVNWAVLIALPWSFFSQVYAILHHQRREQALLPGIAAVWLLLSFAWASYTYVHHHTHGVTGSDPYCYAQMAVDLVEHRVPVHRFPLAVRMEQLGVSPKAGVHVGYHLPFDASGRAATVWPVGQSVLLALGYWLAGEIGLYLTTPVLGLLSLVVLAALSWELLSSHSTSEKLWVSAVAVFLLATSYAQIERLVVPMADAAAQLFTSLTVLLWLCATRSPAIPRAGRAPRRGTLQSLQRLHSSQCRAWALLAGLSFGAAYCVRHTQLVLGASVLFLTWVRPARKRQKVEMLTLFGLAALLAVIPDLLYHQWVMGHWLRPESLELRHFSLAFVGRMAARMAGDLHSAREFLFVGPFLLYGVWRQWREDRVHFGLLSSWVILVLLIHLPYEALRLRDVLSIFPALCFWTGYGLVGLWRWLQNRQLWPGIPPFLRGFGYTFLIMALFLLRTRSTLGLPRASDFDAFGHLNAFQRAGFAQIGQDTQETALIGASLNSGSVELHSERMAFRPALWRPDEFYTFADDAISRGVPLYLLEDGLEMAAPVAAARQRYHLDLVSLYDIPFYHTGGGSTGGRIPLYRLQPKTS